VRVSYALLQTTLIPPPLAALERAFATGRGLTPADARFVADDAFGMLARNLSESDALFLQGTLTTEGIEVMVVPENDLPRLPDSRIFRRAECNDDALVIYDALDRPKTIPWASLRLIATGFDQKAIKLELIIGDAEEMLTTSIDKLHFNRMPQYHDPRDPKNIGASFVYFVRDLEAHAPNALRNRAANFLTKNEIEGDITEGITYPRPGAYLEEMIWLLWRARQGGI
jgi:hypothetical protein